MSDAKPWVTWQVDGSTTWVGSNEDWRAKTLATCCQRDELVEVVRELVEALDMAAHSEECSRTDECDDERGHDCDHHGRVCPSCDCGVDRWQAATTKARAVLAKWGGK